MQANRLAGEIGMAELLAEVAYHIGMLMLNAGNFITAREYLLKSTTATSQLMEQIPGQYRAKYLSKAWRRDARMRLQEAVDKTGSVLQKIDQGKKSKSDELFRVLYRTTVEATASKDVVDFVPVIVNALSVLEGQSAVVLVRHGESLTWGTLRTELVEELEARLKSMEQKAQGRTYFDHQDGMHTKGTVAWIPFQAQNCGGGIYVF